MKFAIGETLEQLIRRPRCALLVMGIAVGLSQAVTAQAEVSDPAGDYAEEDMGDCLDCHDESSEYPVLSILATQHAVKGDERTPLAAQYECQTCHGPSAAHIEDEEVPPTIIFGPDAPPGPQNDVCLDCHSGGNRMNWIGSTHETQNVTCVSCHTIHTLEDPVRTREMRPDRTFRSGQVAVCFSCHPEQRAASYQFSSHPLRDGEMECSDCHNPHGSMGPKLLVKPTLNETCYTCHAEKRGPFLWEHAPAREDCSICHSTHGSNHAAMLKGRGVFLCQQCHMAEYHPSTAYTGPDPAAGIVDYHSLARGCLNCHSEVHGSNHPSGPRFIR